MIYITLSHLIVPLLSISYTLYKFYLNRELEPLTIHSLMSIVLILSGSFTLPLIASFTIYVYVSSYIMSLAKYTIDNLKAYSGLFTNQETLERLTGFKIPSNLKIEEYSINLKTSLSNKYHSVPPRQKIIYYPAVHKQTVLDLYGEFK